MIRLDLEQAPGREHRSARTGWGFLRWWWTLALVGIGLSGRAQAADCTPVGIDEFRKTVAAAEAAVRKSPEAALPKLEQAESMLPCLKEPVGAQGLSEIYRVRAVARALMRDRDGSQDAFKRAVTVQPSLDCNGVLPGYGTPGQVRELIADCLSARTEARDSVTSIELTSVSGVTALYVDGVLRPISEESASADVPPGKHLVQVAHPDGFRSGWVDVRKPEDEDARAQRVDLKKLGLVPARAQVVETGTIRIEGLEPGAEVILDDRTRRDLPVLRNVEAGERHLLIRSADGSVLGGTVEVKPGEETVYKASFEPVVDSGGGFSLSGGRILTFGTLGIAALSAVGSGVTLGLAQGRYAHSEELYSTYMDAGAGSDFDSLFNSAVEEQAAGNKMHTMGLVMGGVAVLAAGAGGFLLFTSDGGETVRVEPWMAPIPGRNADEAGLALGIRGQF